MKKRLKKQAVICWALDPFQDPSQHHVHALKVLLPMAKSLGAKIQPVTYAAALEVYTGHQLAADLQQGKLKGLLAESVNNRLKKMLPASDRPLLQSIHIITPPKGGPADTYTKIVSIDRYAQKLGAKFIAIHSHAKSGLKRLLLGSFAEAAISSSKLPTLVINPASHPEKKIKNIIFPSDFSPESQKSLKLANYFASELGANLTITHCLRIPELPELLADKTSKAQLTADLQLLKSDLERRAAKFLANCKQKKVNAQFDLIEVRPNLDPADALTRLSAAKDSSLIIMAAKSGAIRANLLGSLSRKIARIATCPVLIDRLQK